MFAAAWCLLWWWEEEEEEEEFGEEEFGEEGEKGEARCCENTRRVTEASSDEAIRCVKIARHAEIGRRSGHTPKSFINSRKSPTSTPWKRPCLGGGGARGRLVVVPNVFSPEKEDDK